MSRQSSPALLLPIMAILALIFPVAFSTRQGASSGSAGFAPATSALSGSSQKTARPHDAIRILTEFFAPVEIGALQAGESPVRANATLDLMIVTIPDPIDSQLPYLFDRNLGALQRAAEADNYLLDRFDLPWREELKEKVGVASGGSASSPADAETEHRAEREPGLLLFRNPAPEPEPDPKPAAASSQKQARVLLVFLVGETPTTGIHKKAMLSALDQIERLCHGEIPRYFPRPSAAADADACNTIKVLAPSFSGSGESLDIALHAWSKTQGPARRLRFRIVAGTATALPKGTGTGRSFLSFPDRPGSTFETTVIRDDVALEVLYRYFAAQKRGSSKRLRIALLSEGNTAYGAAIRSAHGSSANAQEDIEVVNLSFPLHVSRLRSELESLRKKNQQAKDADGSVTGPSSLTLPLPTEDDSEEAKDSIPPFSQLEISASERIVSNLLATISQEKFHYVGIAATDVRDVIFLAREIREHSASAVIFALNADLLYGHPEANPNTRGMLVPTPYPLFSLNERWTAINSKAAAVRIQFPDQGTEGLYNAMLHLLGADEALLEYRSPFRDPHCPSDETKLCLTPPVWIVTVGRDGFWPVAVRKLGDTSGYTAVVEAPAEGFGDSHANDGMVPELTRLLLVLWTIVCCVPAALWLLYLSETLPSNTASAAGNKLVDWLQARAPAIHLFRQERSDALAFYLIAATSCLSVFLLAITAFCLASIRRDPNLYWPFTLAVAFMIAIMLLGLFACLSLAKNILKSALLPSGSNAHGPSNRWSRLVLLLAVVGCWCLVLSLAANWIFAEHRGDRVITAFRALNLQSGVSPLPPFFFVCLAALFWAVCALRRIYFAQSLPSVASNAQSTATRDAGFFYSDARSFRGLRTIEETLRKLLVSPTLLTNNQACLPLCVLLLLVLAWGAYLFFYRLVYGFEAQAFYRLLGVSFLLVAAAVLANVARLYLIWRTLCCVLVRAGRLPMREAFVRFHVNNRTIPKISLAAAPSPLTALGLSVNSARQLVASGEDAQSLLPQNKEFAFVVGTGRDLVNSAKSRYERALLQEACGDHKSSSAQQVKAQRLLNRFTRAVEDLLEVSWGAPLPASQELSQQDAARKRLQQQAEEFLVSRTVHFLAHIFPQLTNLAVYSLICLFLMLLAVSCYPLQPKNPFAYFSWFVILVFLGVAGHIAVQMNRDAVLSCLNGSKPGEITWDAEFIGRVVFLLVIPLLGLLGVQFPETIGQVLHWAMPAGGAGH
ncbi:MAG TPA: hypothetical protein VMT51_01775 [Dongiaceae bacterium]|nr:hypothetical protein [Dongiaceae bacterium]